MAQTKGSGSAAKKENTQKKTAQKQGNKPKSGSASAQKPASKKKKQPPQATQGERVKSEVLGVVLMGLGVLFGIYLYFTPDSPLGLAINHILYGATGLLAAVMPPLLFIFGILTVAGRKRPPVKGRVLVCVLFVLFSCAMVHALCNIPFRTAEGEALAFSDYVLDSYDRAIGAKSGVNRAGGIPGALLCFGLQLLGGQVLCGVVTVMGVIICLLLMTRMSLITFPNALKNGFNKLIDIIEPEEEPMTHEEETDIFLEAVRQRKHYRDMSVKSKEDKTERDSQEETEEDTIILFPKEGKGKRKTVKAKQEYTVSEDGFCEEPIDDVLPLRKAKPIKKQPLEPLEQEIKEEKAPSAPLPVKEPEPIEEEPEEEETIPAPLQRSKDIDYGTLEEAFTPRAYKEGEKAPHPQQTAKTEAFVYHDEATGEALPMAQEAPKSYTPPPVACLQEPKRTYGKPTDSPQQTGELLIETLRSFNIEAKLVHISVGPVVTRFELQPAPGVRVNRITSLSNDIALALAAPRVRIEAPIPGKAAVGVEVPNKNAATVLLRDIIDSKDFTAMSSPIGMALGKDIGGNVVVADLAKMPHLLIAGSTGSGKSVCINTLILSMIFRSAPKDLRFIMVDPKQVELSVYAKLPHLLIPVVTDPKKAAGALRWAVNEMTLRYNKFSKLGVRDLKRYNQVQEEEKDILPRIVVIIDELADLMMVAPDEVEDCICRVAQLGRAAGIHLIVATQRPSSEVITGLIKANIPSRVAFMVSSAIDSRIILDTAGAEKLLGNGDCLFHPNGAGKPIRLQGAFVSDTEVESVMDHFIKNGSSEPQFDKQIIEDMAATGGAKGGVFGEGKQEDELLGEAVRIVLDSGQASISMIQRKLRVGYARAARLVDMMEEKGYVSGFDGSKPRKVNITRARYEAIFGAEQGIPAGEEDVPWEE